MIDAAVCVGDDGDRLICIDEYADRRRYQIKALIRCIISPVATYWLNALSPPTHRPLCSPQMRPGQWRLVEQLRSLMLPSRTGCLDFPHYRVAANVLYRKKQLLAACWGDVPGGFTPPTLKRRERAGRRENHAVKFHGASQVRSFLLLHKNKRFEKERRQ